MNGKTFFLLRSGKGLKKNLLFIFIFFSKAKLNLFALKAKWCFSRCPKFVLIIQTFRWREKSSQCCAAGKKAKKVFHIAAAVAAAAAYLPSLPFFHKKLYMLMLCSWVAKNWVSFGSATKKWKIAAWMDSEKEQR